MFNYNICKFPNLVNNPTTNQLPIPGPVNTPIDQPQISTSAGINELSISTTATTPISSITPPIPTSASASANQISNPGSLCVTPQIPSSTSVTVNQQLMPTSDNTYNTYLATSNRYQSLHPLQEPPIPARCLPIKPSKKGNYMPSSMINKLEFIHPSVIIQKYPAYRTASRVQTLARKLAEKAYFGEAVLKCCTIAGYRDEPALPIQELNELKAQMFSLLPQFWAILLEFKQTRSNCTYSFNWEALQDAETEGKNNCMYVITWKI